MTQDGNKIRIVIVIEGNLFMEEHAYLAMKILSKVS
jgi:hypothetical protein